MNYLTTAEAAEKWGISRRRVNVLCNEGRIIGGRRLIYEKQRCLRVY